MRDLFERGLFTLASGQQSDFKVECDALTTESWLTIAEQIAKRAKPFGTVLGVPRGGVPLAVALMLHVTHGAPGRLLVDDVWTTGGSVAKLWQPGDEVWVVFARGRLDQQPFKANALWNMHGTF